jgi:hypothetical protein
MITIRAIGLALTAALAFTTPALAQCTHCVIQTKVPSTSAPGKFDYRISCIVDISGDEVNSAVTAATDDEAVEAVRRKGC